MFSYVRLEMTRVLRDGGYLFMTVISPVTMYLLFTHIKLTGDGTEVYSMVGLAGFGAVGAVLTSGVGIAEDKPLGWIRQLRLLPLRPLQVVAGRALCALAVAVPPIVAVCGAGLLVNGVSLGVGQWAAVLGLLWLGITPIAVLGLGLGYLFDAQKAQASGATVYMGLSVLGGLWFPTSQFPGWLAGISRMTPINRYGELSWRVADGHAPSLTGLAVLTGWCALFVAFAVYAYGRAARTP